MEKVECRIDGLRMACSCDLGITGKKPWRPIGTKHANGTTVLKSSETLYTQRSPDNLANQCLGEAGQSLLQALKKLLRLTLLHLIGGSPVKRSLKHASGHSHVSWGPFPDASGYCLSRQHVFPEQKGGFTRALHWRRCGVAGS